MFSPGDFVIIFIVITLTIALVGYFFFFTTRLDTTEKQVTDSSTHIDERVQGLAEYSASNFAPIESVAALQSSIQDVSKTLHEKTRALSNLIAKTNQDTQSTLSHSIATVATDTRDYSHNTDALLTDVTDLMKNVSSDLFFKYTSVKQECDDRSKHVDKSLSLAKQTYNNDYNNFMTSYKNDNRQFSNKIRAISALQDDAQVSHNALGSKVSTLYSAHNQLAQYTTNADATLKKQIDSYYDNLNSLRNFTYTNASNVNSNIKGLENKTGAALQFLYDEMGKGYNALNSNIVTVGNNTATSLKNTSSNLNSLVASNYNRVSTTLSNYQTNVNSYMSSSIAQLNNAATQQAKTQKLYTDAEVTKASTKWMDYMTTMSNVKSIEGDVAKFKSISMPGVKASCRVVDPGWKVMGTQSNNWNTYLSMCKDNEYMNGINVMWNGNVDGKSNQGARVLARCCKIPGLIDESVPTFYGTTYSNPNKYLGVVPA
jgi:hypothetical protein